ncbi:MAG TPA: amidohydrolase family protein [Holophagaceae bacterium]|nr:amidohydrolase family protein [Holophagaceae bacterium]
MNPLPPLIDRHVHLEGGLDPAWVRAEAALRGVPLPASLEALWRGEAQPFEAFIEAFLFGAQLLASENAVAAAVAAIATRTARAGGTGFDLWCSPSALVSHWKLLSLDAFWRGLERGLADARAQGLSACVVVDAVNHFGPDHGHAVLDLIEGDLPPYVVGFSTGGLERVPFRQWAPVFDRARKRGLRIAAHAGENGDADQVREAILEGGVARIVHGLRSDGATLELLAHRRIPVDVCPRSNALLAADVRPHPLPRMLAAGVRCALGTDDPGVIPCDLASEREAARALGASEADLDRMRRFGAEDAWCLG